ncbi:MAG TPA: ATP synthase F1 subunit epsilon [Microthrixaceae bacterium]|nr:ATP synthase F1 subunit epsilon [Microthrixaceae bacterium]
MGTLHVELVSPERIAYSGEAKVVVARTVEGDIAFLPGHVPLVGVLVTHPVRVIQADDTEVAIAVHSGFVEVAPGEGDVTRVTVLSDVCELADVIDVHRAEAAAERARTALGADPDDEEAKAALARAEVRLDVAGATPAASH